MNTIYDNGCLLIGNLENVINYIDRENFDEDIYLELYDFLNELKQNGNIDIVCVNYDNPMGYSVDYWSKNDIINN